ncbi:MAG: efflux RND transporter periplasmic adaptor subunit, partial [Nitrospirota bacterium]|nr:efflux RND transporter periplasmic adaptor subunit [Nitrospirota bacterium]
RAGIVLVLFGVGVVVKWYVLTSDPILVSVVAVERGRVETTVTNSRAGTVKARQRAKLSPEIGGRVAEIPHRKGARVHAGEVLLRLHDDTQQAAVQMAQRELAVVEVKRERACLEAARAEREFLRHQQLKARDLVSTDLLDKFENLAQTTQVSCKQSRAEIARARSAINEAKAELAKTVLLAPFGGVIAELEVEVGEWTTPSPPALPIPPILDLIDPSSIYISAPMDEVDSSKIHEGQPVRITLDPFPGQPYPGHVRHLAPYVLDVEEQNRTVEIEVELDDQSFASRLLPGTSADVEVILAVKDDVLRIPPSTLFEGHKVFVVNQEVLSIRPIEIGMKNWDFVEILEGLSEGDAVVTSLDQEGLEAGLQVIVHSSPGKQ